MKFFVEFLTVKKILIKLEVWRLFGINCDKSKNKILIKFKDARCRSIRAENMK